MAVLYHGVAPGENIPPVSLQRQFIPTRTFLSFAAKQFLLA